MIRLLVLLAAVVYVMSSCGGPDNSPEAIRERLIQGEFDAYVHTQRVPCDSLQTDSLGLFTYQDSIFTGICFNNFPNIEAKLEERQIFQGQMHGHHLLFTPKGDTISVNLYSFGRLLRKSMGKSEVVNCDSLKVELNHLGEEIRTYFGTPYNGSCNRYYPAPDTNQVYITIPYHNGKVHGEMVVFDKQGNILVKETYNDGEKIQ